MWTCNACLLIYLCKKCFLLSYCSPTWNALWQHIDIVKINDVLINTREHICNQIVYISEACGEHFVHEFSSSWSSAIAGGKNTRYSPHEHLCSVSKKLNHIKQCFWSLKIDAFTMVWNFHIGNLDCILKLSVIQYDLSSMTAGQRTIEKGQWPSCPLFR